MADMNLAIGNTVQVQKYKDMGDGTYAPTVSIAGSQITAISVATLTRAAPTTQYTTLDSIANSTTAPVPIEFTNAGRVAGSYGRIIGAKVTKSTTSVTTPEIRLHLYNATVVATNDNDALAQSLANAPKRVGIINFTTFVAGTDYAEAYGVLTPTNIPFVTAGTSLFGLVQAVGGYTPGASETFRFELMISQD